MIREIYLKNFLGHKDLNLEFAAGLNVITGLSGIGKSSLFRAIGFTLFDYPTFAAGVRKSDLLRWGSKFGFTQINYDTRLGQPRALKRDIDTSGIRLWDPSVTVDSYLAEGADAVYRMIRSDLGLPTNVSLQTLFEGVIAPLQHNIHTPFEWPARQRKDYFEEVVGVAAYREADQKLVDVARLIHDALDRLKYEIQDARRRLTRQGEIELAQGLAAAEEERLESEINQQYIQHIAASDEQGVWAGDYAIWQDLVRKGNELRATIRLGDTCPTCGQDIGHLVSDLSDKLSKLDIRIAGLTPTVIRYKELDTEIKTISADIARLAGQLEAHRRQMENAVPTDTEDISNHLAYLNDQTSTLKSKETNLQAIRHALRSAGPLIAGQVVEQLSYSTTEIASRIVTGLSSVTLSPDFGVSAVIDGNTLDFKSQLSGGQKTLVALSIRIAMARDVLQLPFLMLDEPTASLDAGQKQRLAETLVSLGFDQILLITHDDRFAQVADNVITL